MSESSGIRAQAHLHHSYFLGLQLMVASRSDPAVVGDWMFKLFRRQHEDKFLASFDKLGLHHLPDAVACAKYHVMSNSVGGVPVEYMYESDRKAWVRFRYPRWMYHGPTICGIPIEVSRGFLNGWYAQNGVSLNNPKLGFVCVSEDMTGEFGLCGYFQEYDEDLLPEGRLRFAPEEFPPEYQADEQPRLPSSEWSDERLEKANRNYAVEYVRNGISQLCRVVGKDKTLAYAGRAARLIGLQYLQDTRTMVGTIDGDVNDAATYLATMLRGMGDKVVVNTSQTGREAVVSQTGLAIVKGMDEEVSAVVFDCWSQLWVGAMGSFQRIKRLDIERSGAEIVWRITDR